MIAELFRLFGDDVSGAPASTQRERVNDTVGIAVPTGTNEPHELPWVKDSGADLLDLTDPLHPTIIEAGDYAFNMCIEVDTMTPVGHEGESWFVGFDIDINGDDIFSDNYSSFPDAAATSNGQTGKLSVQLSYWLAAGAVCQVAVRQFTGADVPFHLSGFIRRLSTAGA